MKNKRVQHFAPVLIIVMLFLLSVQSLTAQSNEFSYQGSLKVNSQPANGNFEFQFKLYDALSGGTQVGPTLTRSNVNVAEGTFTVDLDFGGQFSGAGRWLDISVQQNPGANSKDPELGGFTQLAPRQKLASVPYAIRSISSNTATTATTATNATQLGGVNSNQFVLTTDPRMSDARTPTAGSNDYIQNRTAQQLIANFNVSGTGTASFFSAGTQYNIANNRILSSPGTLNTFVGINNGLDITTGGRNTFVGRDTGANTTTGSRNTFVGSGAGFENIGASDNSFYGYNSGLRVTSGFANSFFGVSAGSANLIGDNNSFFGYESGLLSTGNDNSFYGESAGRGTSTGSNNSFIGVDAGISNTTGGNNTAIGRSANMGAGNLSFATAIGAQSVVTSSNTIALGRPAGNDSVYIPGNLGVGATPAFAGANVETPQVKILAGNCPSLLVGIFLTNNVNESVCNGARITFSGSALQIYGRIGSEVRVGGMRFLPDGTSAPFRATSGGNLPLCIAENTAPGGGIVDVFANCSSSRRYKSDIDSFSSGISLIERLRPVSFKWKNGGMLDLGLVAEEVAEIEPRLVTYNDKGQVEGVKYDRIGVIAINAIMEQRDQIESQQIQIDEQKETIKQQSKQLKKQQNQIEALKVLVCSQNPTAALCNVDEETK